MNQARILCDPNVEEMRLKCFQDFQYEHKRVHSRLSILHVIFTLCKIDDKKLPARLLSCLLHRPLVDSAPKSSRFTCNSKEELERDYIERSHPLLSGNIKSFLTT